MVFSTNIYSCLATDSSICAWASTLVRVDHIRTVATVEAWVSIALVNLLLASDTREATFTLTSEASSRSIIYATSSILARRVRTIVDVVLAVFPFEAVAFAVISSSGVLTNTLVLADVFVKLTLVFIDITKSACPTRRTVANSFAVVVMLADTAVVTDAAVGTLVKFCVAIFATVSRVTNALDIVSILGTTCSVLAWISCLADCRDLALFPFEVGRTLAPARVCSGSKVVANRDRNAVVVTEAVVCAEV